MSELIRALEWDRFIELAQLEAKTSPGKAALASLLTPSEWATHPGAAEFMQLETSEVTPLLDRDALWGPLNELLDPEDLLNLLAQGSVLEVSDLGLLRRWLYAIDSWAQVPREEIRGEHFKKVLAHLMDPFNLLKALDRILTPEGELSEKASPKLASLYKDIRSLKREIEITLDHLLKSYSQKGLLQETFSDVRDGRYVIPVKISSQSEIEGIIHEASVSRQTVFIEPQEVTLLNNRLRTAQNQIIQEMFIILETACKQLQPFVSEIRGAVASLVHWDSVQAKARLGRHYSGKSIHVNRERLFDLKQTGHPLLWWSMPPESIIRNDLYFGQEARALLITGPNTGGKTVLLKTLGLASLCARTGFPFPATDHPHVPFFDSIFTDLGDPQSIEKQLSSFSGHVLKIKEVLDHMTDQSLVLIDELNSATDPEEGAAFGRAIIETLITRDAMLVTTTHDPHLKALALSNPKILNASMEFNEKQSTPTYQIILGVPGRSRALETAERYGIPHSVIQLARSYLSQGHQDFERMLGKLESDLHETARARKEAILLREEAEKLKNEWTQRMENSLGEITTRVRQKMRRTLEQAQDEVRASVRKLDEARHHKAMDQTRSNLNEVIAGSLAELDSILKEEAPEMAEKLTPFLSPSTASVTPASPLLQIGMKVRVPRWKTTGAILEVLETKVKIAMGTLQMLLPLEEVELLEGEKGSKPGSPYGRVNTSTPPAPEPKLDLRGQRLDDAMRELSLYLDMAYRSGAYAEVTVVHGLGTGALREGTLKILKKLPYVKTFRDGGAGHGGTGATIIEFDR